MQTIVLRDVVLQVQVFHQSVVDVFLPSSSWVFTVQASLKLLSPSRFRDCVKCLCVRIKFATH